MYLFSRLVTPSCLFVGSFYVLNKYFMKARLSKLITHKRHSAVNNHFKKRFCLLLRLYFKRELIWSYRFGYKTALCGKRQYIAVTLYRQVHSAVAFLYLVKVALQYSRTVMKYRNILAEFFYYGHLVTGHDYILFLIYLLVYNTLEKIGVNRIKSAQRLIKYDKLRVCDKRRYKLYLLLITLESCSALLSS